MTCAPDRIDERVKIGHVIDGDTVALGDGRHLRLIGVDTPEIGHHGDASQPLALEARDRLRLLLARNNNSLTLRYDAERQDHYQRTLAHAYLMSGQSLSAWLLEQGIATLLVIPPNVDGVDCYAVAERNARAARRGVWALPGYQVRDAATLGRHAQGYHQVRGRVERIGRSRDALWLNLAGGLALRIVQEDLRWFGALRPETLQGRTVIARGMIYERNNQLRMQIRYPTSLEVSQ